MVTKMNLKVVTPNLVSMRTCQNNYIQKRKAYDFIQNSKKQNNSEHLKIGYE